MSYSYTTLSHRSVQAAHAIIEAMSLRHPSHTQKSGRHKKRVVFWPRRIQPRITTLVIGSKSLVSEACGPLALHPFGVATMASLRTTLAHALKGSQHPLHEQILAQLPSISLEPAARYDSTIAGSAWHQGDHYMLYWYGPAEQMIQRSDLTDNEREQLLAQARSLAVAGSIVYVAGRTLLPHTKHTDLTAVQPNDLQIDGIVAYNVRLWPGTRDALDFCNRQGIQVVYASAEPMLTTAAVAIHTGLLAKEQLPVRILSTMRPVVAPVYASVSERVRRQIVATFDTDHTLATDKPLTEVVKTIVIN